MLGKIQSWMRDPLISSVAFNLWLILLWYFFGTALSLFNKLVLGGAEGKGLFHAGRFPAPFMFTSWQLFLQVLFSKALPRLRELWISPAEQRLTASNTYGPLIHIFCGKSPT